MKCPTCLRNGKILETRTNDDDSKRRRYECTQGHRYSTREVIFENPVCEKQTAVRDSGKPSMSTLWALSVAGVS